ncbi:hypothetical protein DBV15_04159 [Temnothorax longispinosus]|uniref:Uncharacterized protein n=1 Tax=Temnothorax longispinosus TaxID=300112 RepID=A0A4S2KWP4_9HYME|nr:hypothetical protein DBV15_04159 [Temnothorax longispinosus]
MAEARRSAPAIARHIPDIPRASRGYGNRSKTFQFFMGPFSVSNTFVVSEGVQTLRCKIIKSRIGETGVCKLDTKAKRKPLSEEREVKECEEVGQHQHKLPTSCWQVATQNCYLVKALTCRQIYGLSCHNSASNTYYVVGNMPATMQTRCYLVCNVAGMLPANCSVVTRIVATEPQLSANCCLLHDMTILNSNLPATC